LGYELHQVGDRDIDLVSATTGGAAVVFVGENEDLAGGVYTTNFHAVGVDVAVVNF
jgi:hypothetical protein